MESNNLNLNIKIPDIKKTLTIAISSSSKVSDLKKKIEELSGVPPITQKLVSKGKILKDDSSQLSSYNIINESTIIVLKNKNIIPQNTSNNNNNPFSNLLNMINNNNNNNNNMNNLNNLMNNMMNNNMMNNMMNNPQINQILQNPQYMQMMNQLLQDPNGLSRLMNNPRVRQMMNANPQMRSLMQNPDMMRNMMNMMRGGLPGFNGNSMFSPYNAFGTPNTNLSQLYQEWVDKKKNGKNLNNNINNNSNNDNNNFGNLFNMFNNLNNNNNNNNSNIPNFSHLFSGLQNMNNNNNEESQSQNNIDYTVLYSEQLQQLKDMGFTDEQENIRALISCQGNVQFAVDKIVNNM